MVKKGCKKYKKIHIMVAIIIIFYAVCIPLMQVMALTTADGFTYTKYSDRVIITKYSGTASVVTIPSTIDALPVTGIGDNTFDNSSITSITIPDSVTSIGHKAFNSCTSLTSVTIPNSVTSLGNEVFNNCTNLSSISIGTGITSISYKTFADCKGLTSVTILGSVTSIGNYAFNSCTSLTSITIPDSVKSIGNYAFQNCKSLTNVTIPKGVTSIGDRTFFGCIALTSVTIPNSVTSMGAYAFAYCDKLTSVIIPDSVTGISDYSFFKCTSLNSVTMESSLVNVSDLLAFDNNGTKFTIYKDPKDTNTTKTFKVNLKDVTITLVQEKSYTVTFKDYDGTVISTQTISEGLNATAPADPTRTGYTFKGWDKAFANITQDTEVKATYTENIYKVTFKDYDGREIATQTISEGLNATAPAEPTRTGYTFTGWDKAYTNITKNTEITATYTKNSPNSYTVTFKDYDGREIATQTISEGLNAIAPTNPTRTGYTFTGWDKAFANITQNTEVTATYRNNASVNHLSGSEVTTPAAVTIEIKGTERVGKTLSAEIIRKNGSKVTTSAAVTYEWYRISSEDSGSVTPVGNDKTYKLVSGDKRNYIQLTVCRDGEEIGSDITGKIKERLSSSSSSSSSRSARKGVTGNGIVTQPTSNDIALGLMLQTANENKVELTNSWGDKNLGGTVSNVVDRNGRYTGSIITAFESGTARLPIEYSDFKYLKYIYKYEPITNLLIKIQEVVNINGKNIEVPVKKDETYYITKSPVFENLLLKEGWNAINGSTYRVEGSDLKSGWIQEGNKWYYIDETSKARVENSWSLVNNKWYDFNQKGEMKIGWNYNGGNWYFLDITNGDMRTGWKLEGNIWYNLTSNGAMSIGWKNIDGLWYYFNSDGSMAANTVIDGYVLGANGAWIE